MTYAVGTRLRLRHDVDRYPHFVAPAGALGTVTDTSDAICVRMDDHVPGAEEWDNEVCWYPANGDDISCDVEEITP